MSYIVATALQSATNSLCNRLDALVAEIRELKEEIKEIKEIKAPKDKDI